jgi:hypothetical protein
MDPNSKIFIWHHSVALTVCASLLLPGPGLEGASGDTFESTGVCVSAPNHKH